MDFKRQLYLLLTIITDYCGFCNIVLEICYMWFLQVFWLIFAKFTNDLRRVRKDLWDDIHWRWWTRKAWLIHTPLYVNQGFLPRSFKKVSRATEDYAGKTLHIYPNLEDFVNSRKIPKILEPKSPRTIANIFLKHKATSPRKIERNGQRRSPGRPTLTPQVSRPRDSVCRLKISFFPRLLQGINIKFRPRDEASNSLSRREDDDKRDYN